jgi:hypothetical protein
LEKGRAGIETRRHPVGSIALKAGLTRGRRYTGDELVEMIVAWYVGDDIGESERGAIIKVGVNLTQPGLRALADVDPAIAERMRHRLAEVLKRETRARRSTGGTERSPTPSSFARLGHLELLEPGAGRVEQDMTVRPDDLHRGSWRQLEVEVGGDPFGVPDEFFAGQAERF